METFYDGDLKDIWDSDLDPTDTFKLSSDTEMHEWLLERDVKIPTVILNDKLISDALFNGTLPIKSEHSYSLNSDGDSMPDSPRSLHTKMEDMDDDYYPAISLKSATCNTRRLHTATIDPNCLTIAATAATAATATTPASATCPPAGVTTLTTCASSSGSNLNTANPMLTATSTAALLSSSSSVNNNSSSSNNSHSSLSNNSSQIYAGLNRMASAPMTFNLRTLTTTSCNNASNSNSISSINNNNTNISNINTNNTSATISKQLQMQLQLQQQQQQLQQQQLILQQQRHELHGFATIVGTTCTSPATSRDGSVSPDICSDIEIDESCIKDEPMSPSSSCPPSPSNTGGGTLSLNMANVAAYTNSDLVFEHKNGSLQLTPASQSLLKSQQFILSSTSNGQSIVIPKVNIKTESATSSGSNTTLIANGKASNNNNNSNNGSAAFGLPPTPPSSMPSDDSEGNQSPEHLLSPLSPSSTGNNAVLGHQNNSSAGATAVNSSNNNNTTTITSASATSARRSTSSSSSSSSSQSNSPASSSSHAGRTFSGSSTRQPIHTPLISSQPKGSTGTLILTEEEKRTLLAEGYPIPQRLPLSKAEEKSLKKIRRKIKNKISAQESRRKKKEYMDQLERKVEVLVNENIDYKKRVESLEDSNASLLSQLQKLQALVNKQNAKKA